LDEKKLGVKLDEKNGVKLDEKVGVMRKGGRLKKRGKTCRGGNLWQKWVGVKSGKKVGVWRKNPELGVSKS